MGGSVKGLDLDRGELASWVKTLNKRSEEEDNEESPSRKLAVFPFHKNP